MGHDIVETTGASDRFADYCLWDYAPLAATRGKIRSCSLLWFVLEHLGWREARRICEAVRTALGPFQTVWGLKKRGDLYSLELYFYDYARLERRISLSRVRSALAPMLASDFVDVEKRPYFMVSIEITPESSVSGRLGEATMYIGNPGSSVSSGISYTLARDGLTLDNLYYFFDRAAQADDIRAKVACSAYHDLGARPLDAVLWPDLLTCKTVVIANKRRNDGVYFSRLPFEGFAGFLGRAGFPAPLVAFVGAERGRLDHMLYDVGFDYVAAPGGIGVVKSAFYGLL